MFDLGKSNTVDFRKSNIVEFRFWKIEHGRFTIFWHRVWTVCLTSDGSGRFLTNVSSSRLQKRRPTPCLRLLKRIARADPYFVTNSDSTLGPNRSPLLTSYIERSLWLERNVFSTGMPQHGLATWAISPSTRSYPATFWDRPGGLN